MDYCQYFTNLVIAPKGKTKELTTLYGAIGGQYGGKFASRQASEPSDILPVFRELFKAKTGVPLTQTGRPAHIHSFGMPAAAP